MLKWFAQLFNRRNSSEIAARKEAIERLILAHQRRLQKLKEHQASPHRETVPPHVLVEMEEVEAKIQQLQAALENEGVDREKTERVLTAHQRRLDTLKKIGVPDKSSDYL